MDNPAYIAATNLFKSIFVLLKLGAVVQSPNPSDGEALNQKREQILAHLEKVKQGIDEFSMDKIRSMVAQLQVAVNYVNNYDFENAHKYFLLMDDGYKVAYALAATFEHKLLVTRLKFLSILCLGYFFYNETGQPPNIPVLQTKCQAVFDRIAQINLVTKTIKDEFEGRSVFNVVKRRMSNENPRNDRHIVLNEINLLNWFLYDTFRTKATFSVFKNKVSMDLSYAKPVEFSININGSVGLINKIWVFKNKIYTVHLGDVHIYVWDSVLFNQIGILSGHSSQVECLEYYSPTDRLFSGGKDRNILVWDATGLSQVASLAGHNDWVWCMACTVNTLYSCSDDGTIKIWDLSSYTLSHTVPCKDIKCFAIRNDKLYAGANNAIHTFNLVTLALENTQVVRGNVSCVTIYENKGGRCTSTRVIDVSVAANGDGMDGADGVAEVTVGVANVAVSSGSAGASASASGVGSSSIACVGGTAVWLIAAIDTSNSQHEIVIYNVSDFSVVTKLAGHNYYITAMYVFNHKLYSNSRDNNMLIHDLSSFESLRENKLLTTGYRDLAVSNCRLFTVHSKYPATIQINLL